MSAAVCGSKRTFFEEIPSPPSSKRTRCSPSSTSPARFSPPPQSAPLDQLRSAFPHVEIELLARLLEECGNNLEAAMKSYLAYSEEKSVSAEETVAEGMQGGSANKGDIVAAVESVFASESLPSNGVEWVETLVKEILQSTNMDDAKARASRVLEVLEKVISGHAREEAGKVFQEQCVEFQENMSLKQQIEALIKDNALLKRAVAIQYERQREYEEMNRELQFLKQFAPQVQEKLRNLEVENYTLIMRLKHAEQNSSIPGRFHPDVF